MIFTPHSDKQESAIFSEKDITVLCTGIQYGKTTAGAIWLKRRCHMHPGMNFLVTAPTYKVMNQSSLPAFLETFRGFGEYKRGESVFQLICGGNVYFRTATDPDSVVGITNVKGIWGDEAGKFPLYFWDNMEARAAFMNSPIMLTTSPYALNWLYKDLIRPSKQGRRKDVFLVQAASIENPYFPRQVYEKRKETMDPRRFNAIYGGQFERMQGLVYNCFHDQENIYEAADFDNARYFAGVDWGFTDPFVFVVRAVTPEGKHYQVSEFYKTGMTVTDMVKLAKSKCQIYNIETVYCDPSQPGYILEMQQAGIPATKANNDIRAGIDLHYDLIKTRRYKIFKGSSPLTMNELETYHWPEPKDLLPDQDAKAEKPVDQDNHAMDANRYVTIMTYRSGVKLIPKANEESSRAIKEPESPAEFIKRTRRKRMDQTESWS